MKSLRTFPAGSAGGPDSLTAAHLSDMLNSATDDKLKHSLTDFVNLLLKSDLPVPVREILYEGRLIALQKRDGGIRPIDVGYTLRRLAAKCGNAFVIKRRNEELKPIQVGVGVSGGAEAAVHATRRLLSNLQDNNVFVKLDFTYAFNSVRRNTILTKVAQKMPELYRFTCDSLDCNS